MHRLATALILCLLPLVARGEDQLSSILVPGEDWQVVVDNLNFCDGFSCDGAGNVYFCELKAKPAVIYRIGPDNSRTKVAETARSGTKVGPDGNLYCCGNKAITKVDMATGKETVLTDHDVVPNDLVITKTGLIFITETASKRLTCFNPKTKEQKVADEGTVNKPNGIGLSPDQSTLIISEVGGLKVWTFKIGADGSLSDKKALMTMKAPANKPTVASGDGMTVDTEGRAYVTSAVGVQIFAPTGELLGVLPKINEKSPLVSTTFGGPGLSYLYIAHGDKIYRRKLNAKGTGSFSQ